MSRPKPVRCAIYSRKSSEEGLEQDFNSLHAQHEACLAYIASQRQEGWRPVADRYDDGGLSGGTLERPALQRLLRDIDAGAIDMVVVYKIDRLTRSLSDFSKIIDRFEAAGASFVSVTQQFNTSTSMGRLTLNVLLSFAQFEREVTAERIRDKIAASKKKGMWMGGLTPLGYDARDGALVVNPAEAETVRSLFANYLKLGCVRELKEMTDRHGLRSKCRTFASGREAGGGSFSRGALYKILSNPVYVGAIRHRGALYEGRHEAIIDRETWDAVQAKLATGNLRRCGKPSGRTSPLAGKLFDESEERLTPSHARKGDRSYRYYVSRRLTTGAGKDEGQTWRLPADELERRVAEAVLSAIDRVPAGSTLGDRQDRERCLSSLRDAGPSRPLALVSKVVLGADTLTLCLDDTALADALPAALAQFVEPVIAAPFDLRRRGVEARLVMEERSAEVDDRVVGLIAKGHRYWREICGGGSIAAIARRERVTPSWIGQVAQLAFLSPAIIEACLAGRHPPELSAKSLMLQRLPLDWQAQHRVLFGGVHRSAEG